MLKCMNFQRGNKHLLVYRMMFPIPLLLIPLKYGGIKYIEASICAAEFQIDEYWEEFIIAYNVKV
jgi:hypothetical protein